MKTHGQSESWRRLPGLLVLLAGLFGTALVLMPTLADGQENDNAPVQMVFNARIHTLGPGRDSVVPSAMVFAESGSILAIGEAASLQKEYPDAEKIDLGGKTVLPGLIDSHGHLHGLAVSFTRANLTGAGSKAETLQRLRDFAQDLPEGEWLLGRGWDQNDWPEAVFPSKQDLDAQFPDRPVWLRRIDGHAAWANSMALA